MEKTHCGSDDKQYIKNYRPASLLPACSKIFERLLLNNLYKFLNENDLLSSNQSGFRPGDSCINQLLSIANEIYQSFDNDIEVRGVSLDISKKFDKVWHEGLILKLSRNFWKPIVSFKRFDKILKTMRGIKWSKLVLERNHF